MKNGMTRRAALGIVGTAGAAAVGVTMLTPSRAAAGHLSSALDELRAARREIHESESRFGGHKAEAIDAIDVAIEKLKFCIEHA